MSGQDARTVRTSSLRRRKSKLRKKTFSRKSESSSDGVHAMHNSGSSDGSLNHHCSARKSTGGRSIRNIARDSHEHLTTLVKSGSFSGRSAYQELSEERVTVSDPAPAFKFTCCQSNASNSDTEGEERTCNRSKELCNVQFNADSDIEKNSLGTNSFSEQAWDNYQVSVYCNFGVNNPLQRTVLDS